MTRQRPSYAMPFPPEGDGAHNAAAAACEQAAAVVRGVAVFGGQQR